jgi:hypothetical protein
MATQPTGSTEQREDKSGKPQIVVVDFGKPQDPKNVKRLRKGRGKLMTRIESIMGELIESGAVKGTAQPVVIVLRERLMPPWPFS